MTLWAARKPGNQSRSCRLEGDGRGGMKRSQFPSKISWDRTENLWSKLWETTPGLSRSPAVPPLIPAEPGSKQNQAQRLPSDPTLDPTELGSKQNRVNVPPLNPTEPVLFLPSLVQFLHIAPSWDASPKKPFQFNHHTLHPSFLPGLENSWNKLSIKIS